MEHLSKLHIEYLPEGIYPATSDDIQGLIAQGRTIVETVEITHAVAKKIDRDIHNSEEFQCLK